MTGEHGGFFSATDADSEGEEGKFFVWSTDEIEAVLGSEDASLFSAFFRRITAGQLRGQEYPQHFGEGRRLRGTPGGYRWTTWSMSSGAARMPCAMPGKIASIPLLDDKALASWNGLMLKAFAEAGAALERADYLDAAKRNAVFLLTEMRPDGRLQRSYRERQAKLPGFLEDYSFVADGLLSLYESTFESRWLDAAISLADEMISLFWDESGSCFYDTGRDHEELVVRPRDVFDNAQPCGSSVATDLLLRLSVITGNDDYAAKAVALSGRWRN